MIGHGSDHRNINKELHAYKKMGVKRALKEAENLDCVMNAVVCTVCTIRGRDTGLQVDTKIKGDEAEVKETSRN